MPPDNIAEKCQQFNISLPVLLTKAQRRDITDEEVFAAIQQAASRAELIRALKQAGLSLIDLADGVGQSRETVRKIVGTGAPRAAEIARPKPTQTIEEIRRHIWQAAMHDPSWWLNDSLSRDKIIAYLKSCHYPASQIKRGLPSLIWRPKAEIILMIAFGLPPEQHRQWINERLAEGLSYTDILKLINSKIELHLSLPTFLRYCRRVKADERRSGPYSKQKLAARTPEVSLHR